MHSASDESGLIGALGLEAFWESCTDEEKQVLNQYYFETLPTVFSINPEDFSLDKECHISTTESNIRFLHTLLKKASTKRNYVLIEKIVKGAEELKINDNSLLSAHLFWQDAAMTYKNQRNRSEAVERTIKMCQNDIKLFPRYMSYCRERDINVKILTFQILIDIYSKAGQYDKAIEICKFAIDNEVRGGYMDSLLELEKMKRR